MLAVKDYTLPPGHAIGLGLCSPEGIGNTDPFLWDLTLGQVTKGSSKGIALWAWAQGPLDDLSSVCLWLAVEYDESTAIQSPQHVTVPAGRVLAISTHPECVSEFIQQHNPDKEVPAENYLFSTVVEGYYQYLEAADGVTISAGDKSEIVAGNRAKVTAGRHSKATVGNRGVATVGDGGTARVGYDGTATAGRKGIAIAGEDGVATAGDGGKARVGDRGTAKAGIGGKAYAGVGGVAEAGRDGVARTGVDGFAIAGDGGQAYGPAKAIVRAGVGGFARVGRYGTATVGCRGSVEAADFCKVQVGPNGSAIVGQKCLVELSTGAKIRAGNGSILEFAIPPRLPGQPFKALTFTVGVGGVLPDTCYALSPSTGTLAEVRDGGLVDTSILPSTDGLPSLRRMFPFPLS